MCSVSVEPNGSLADLPLRDVVAQLAAATPAPGGGTAAALTCCLAAALVEMSAGFAGSDAEAEVVRGRAAVLRSRSLELAQEDLRSYEPVLAALSLPRGSAQREPAVAEALSSAASVPLRIAGVGAELAGLAAGATASAGRHVRGDAATAAALAEGACRAAALLVELNLSGTSDSRLDEARSAAAQAKSGREHSLINAVGN